MQPPPGVIDCLLGGFAFSRSADQAQATEQVRLESGIEEEDRQREQRPEKHGAAERLHAPISAASSRPMVAGFGRIASGIAHLRVIIEVSGR